MHSIYYSFLRDLLYREDSDPVILEYGEKSRIYLCIIGQFKRPNSDGTWSDKTMWNISIWREENYCLTTESLLILRDVFFYFAACAKHKKQPQQNILRYLAEKRRPGQRYENISFYYGIY